MYKEKAQILENALKSEVFINVRTVSKHLYDNKVLYFPFSIEKISLLYHKERANYNLKMTLISVNELLYLIQIQLFWLYKQTTTVQE